MSCDVRQFSCYCRWCSRRQFDKCVNLDIVRHQPHNPVKPSHAGFKKWRDQGWRSVTQVVKSAPDKAKIAKANCVLSHCLDRRRDPGLTRASAAANSWFLVGLLLLFSDAKKAWRTSRRPSKPCLSTGLPFKRNDGRDLIATMPAAFILAPHVDMMIRTSVH